jgi:DNA-binding PadR family transcriptional regulator
MTRTAPARVRSEAKLGLKLRKKWKRGGTAVGVARAVQLSSGKAVSDATIKRMYSYFQRHQHDRLDKDGSDGSIPGRGYIAWLLWGGNSGRKWAEGEYKKIQGKKKNPISKPVKKIKEDLAKKTIYLIKVSLDDYRSEAWAQEMVTKEEDFEVVDNYDDNGEPIFKTSEYVLAVVPKKYLQDFEFLRRMQMEGKLEKLSFSSAARAWLENDQPLDWFNEQAQDRGYLTKDEYLFLVKVNNPLQLIARGIDPRPVSNYDREELKLGIKTELEHTDDAIIASKIAKDHLDEDPKYYSKLVEMERGMKKSNPEYFLGNPIKLFNKSIRFEVDARTLERSILPYLLLSEIKKNSPNGILALRLKDSVIERLERVFPSEEIGESKPFEFHVSVLYPMIEYFEKRKYISRIGTNPYCITDFGDKTLENWANTISKINQFIEIEKGMKKKNPIGWGYLFRNKELKSIPDEFIKVGWMGILDLNGWSSLESLPDPLYSTGYLNISDCVSLKYLPKVLVAKNIIAKNCISLQHFPSETRISGSIDLENCISLKSLPDNLEVSGSLNLTNCKSLKSLPENLSVLHNLNLTGCSELKSLPKSLKVGRRIIGFNLASQNYEDEKEKNIKSAIKFAAIDYTILSSLNKTNLKGLPFFIILENVRNLLGKNYSKETKDMVEDRLNFYHKNSYILRKPVPSKYFLENYKRESQDNLDKFVYEITDEGITLLEKINDLFSSIDASIEEIKKQKNPSKDGTMTPDEYLPILEEYKSKRKSEPSGEEQKKSNPITPASEEYLDVVQKALAGVSSKVDAWIDENSGDILVGSMAFEEDRSFDDVLVRIKTSGRILQGESVDDSIRKFTEKLMKKIHNELVNYVTHKKSNPRPPQSPKIEKFMASVKAANIDYAILSVLKGAGLLGLPLTILNDQVFKVIDKKGNLTSEKSTLQAVLRRLKMFEKNGYASNRGIDENISKEKFKKLSRASTKLWRIEYKGNELLNQLNDMYILFRQQNIDIQNYEKLAQSIEEDVPEHRKKKNPIEYYNIEPSEYIDTLNKYLKNKKSNPSPAEEISLDKIEELILDSVDQALSHEYDIYNKDRRTDEYDKQKWLKKIRELWAKAVKWKIIYRKKWFENTPIDDGKLEDLQDRIDDKFQKWDRRGLKGTTNLWNNRGIETDKIIRNSRKSNPSKKLKSLKELEQLTTSLAKAAQDVYDDWGTNEDGSTWCRHQEGEGGICHLIADEMIEVISKHGFECLNFSHTDMVHVSVIVKTKEGCVLIDIDPYLYETGGGYNWKKKENVKFEPDDVLFSVINGDPDVFEQHYDSY